MSARSDIDPLNRAVRATIIFIQGVLSSEVTPEKWRWLNDVKHTKSIVTGKYPVKHKDLESRPAIAVHHVGAKFLALGLQDKVTTGLMDEVGEVQDLVTSTLVASVLTKSQSVGTALGWHLMRELRHHIDLLQLWGGLHTTSDAIAMSPPMPAGEYISGAPADEEWSRIVLSLPFSAAEHATPSYQKEAGFHIVARSVRMRFEAEFGPSPSGESSNIDLLNSIAEQATVENPLAVAGVPVEVRRVNPTIAAKRERVAANIRASTGD